MKETPTINACKGIFSLIYFFSGAAILAYTAFFSPGFAGSNDQGGTFNNNFTTNEVVGNASHKQVLPAATNTTVLYNKFQDPFEE
jgi:hypothetical protein